MKHPVVTITARTGGEPELRYTNSGIAVCKVRAAWSKDIPPATPGGDWDRENTTWVTVEWWRKAAEQVAELAIGKGDTIRVTGSLFMEEFTRRDGSIGQGLKLTADGTPAVWPKRDAQDGGGQAPARTPENTPAQGGGQAQQQGFGNGGGYDDPPF
ncbi:hypothetical protein GCM10009592_26740 [Brachybacterium rhamnosum]|uniref:Single-stranded DNA-binding protein n=1 Tax=Brachybacterium rhamnosum TaxID=173361 RepID=A0ABW4PZH2_9MICO